MFGAELNDVAVEAQARIGWDLLLGDTTQIGQVEITLTCPGEGAEVITPLFGDRPISGQGKWRMLYHGATGMGEAAIHGQAIDTNRGVSHALHYRPG